MQLHFYTNYLLCGTNNLENCSKSSDSIGKSLFNRFLNLHKQNSTAKTLILPNNVSTFTETFIEHDYFPTDGTRQFDTDTLKQLVEKQCCHTFTGVKIRHRTRRNFSHRFGTRDSIAGSKNSVHSRLPYRERVIRRNSCQMKANQRFDIATLYRRIPHVVYRRLVRSSIALGLSACCQLIGS